MNPSLLLAALACLYVPSAPAQTTAGSVYKCIAADGSVQYTNVQCPGGSQSSVVSTYDSSAAKAQTPPSAVQPDPAWHERFVAQSTASTPPPAHQAHAAPQATALCNDGTYAYVRGRYACARHGGVQHWL